MRYVLKICASEVMVITQTCIYRLRQIVTRLHFTTPLTCDHLPLCTPFTSSLLPSSSLLGFNMGTGKPVVFAKQVTQVRVRYWILAHCGTPHTCAMVLRVHMG